YSAQGQSRSPYLWLFSSVSPTSTQLIRPELSFTTRLFLPALTGRQSTPPSLIGFIRGVATRFSIGESSTTSVITTSSFPTALFRRDGQNTAEERTPKATILISGFVWWAISAQATITTASADWLNRPKRRCTHSPNCVAAYANN